MGQKIHPTGFRLAVTRNWSSRWYANTKNFGATLGEETVGAALGRPLRGGEVIEMPARSGRVWSSAAPL